MSESVQVLYYWCLIAFTVGIIDYEIERGHITNDPLKNILSYMAINLLTWFVTVIIMFFRMSYWTYKQYVFYYKRKRRKK